MTDLQGIRNIVGTFVIDTMHAIFAVETHGKGILITSWSQGASEKVGTHDRIQSFRDLAKPVMSLSMVVSLVEAQLLL